MIVSLDRFDPPGWKDESAECRSCGVRTELCDLSAIDRYCPACKLIQEEREDEST